MPFVRGLPLPLMLKSDICKESNDSNQPKCFTNRINLIRRTSLSTIGFRLAPISVNCEIYRIAGTFITFYKAT